MEELKELKDKLKTIMWLVPSRMELPKLSVSDVEERCERISKELLESYERVSNSIIENEISKGTIEEYIPYAEGNRELRYRKSREEFIKTYNRS